MAKQRNKSDKNTVELLDALCSKVNWLSAWTIHHANHIRESADGLKVGGHQASSASLATIMTALYFHELKSEDRVAVKPHASPVYHAIQYLLGKQTRDQLKGFRSFGGAQSYPSRTKDKDDVDFSTGSVGLGVGVTVFASLMQDYLIASGKLGAGKAGRMIALMGDAELDEGNIYEAMIEGYKHNLRNCWWIIDYNRQSLDSVSAPGMSDRFQDMFKTLGWDVITLKYGKKLTAAFKKPGGKSLQNWLEAISNELYCALTFKGGSAWRSQLLADIGGAAGVEDLLGGYTDAELADLMTNLGGHDLELLTGTFASVTHDRPVCFVCYTVKGKGLPFEGHKDNHAGLMNPTQMHAYRDQMGIKEGDEWGPFAGLEDSQETLEAFLKDVPFARHANRQFHAGLYDIPEIEIPTGAEQSTQLAFGKIMNTLGRGKSTLSDHIMTTSPDVTVSTNLGGWVNQRQIFSRYEKSDTFKAEKVVSPQGWAMKPAGQHLELGIAENNLFLALAAMGLCDKLFGTRILPVGTLYDPFINRGLDALNYACYQDARFMLVATPSGLSLAPEGGAHQSIHTPVIGMAQPNMTYFEPAYVDELAVIMSWSFDHMQQEHGGSVYLRLSTKPLAQKERSVADIKEGVIKGAYWEVLPDEGSDLAIIYTGVVADEALKALESIREDVPGVGLLAVPSPDMLFKNWSENPLGGSHIEQLLSRLTVNAGLVTIIDGAPQTLGWIGSVMGHKLRPLGVETFGQSGNIPDLYSHHGLDAEAIIDAAASLYL